MEKTVRFEENSDSASPKVLEDPSHNIRLTVDGLRNYALLQCSSREALFELGRTLMEEALFGTGEIEFYPLVSDGQALVVNGVRMPEESARMFVHFPGTAQSSKISEI